MSPSQMPGWLAAENWETALSARSTSGSVPCGSIVYPYAIFRMIAPAFLLPPKYINSVAKLLRKEKLEAEKESDIRPDMLHDLFRRLEHTEEEPARFDFDELAVSRDGGARADGLEDASTECAEPRTVVLHGKGSVPSTPVI